MCEVKSNLMMVSEPGEACHSKSLAMHSVIQEMHSQDDMWGANRDMHHLEWLPILGEEFGEVSKAILENSNIREELVQVAAVALQWIEMIDREENK